MFCLAPGLPDAQPLIVHTAATCFAILNLYPYNGGHLMVVPKRHVATLAGLHDDELVELARVVRMAEIVVTEVYQPSGMNIGVNLGRPAGAGIVDHVHVHLVPRWDGDTNFMPVVGNVRVLPEDLHVTAGRLRPAFARLAGSAPEVAS